MVRLASRVRARPHTVINKPVTFSLLKSRDIYNNPSQTNSTELFALACLLFVCLVKDLFRIIVFNALCRQPNFHCKELNGLTIITTNYPVVNPSTQ